MGLLLGYCRKGVGVSASGAVPSEACWPFYAVLLVARAGGGVKEKTRVCDTLGKN